MLRWRVVSYLDHGAGAQLYFVKASVLSVQFFLLLRPFSSDVFSRSERCVRVAGARHSFPLFAQFNELSCLSLPMVRCSSSLGASGSRLVDSLSSLFCNYSRATGTLRPVVRI